MSGTALKQAALSGARWTVAARIGLQLITWPITILVIRLLEPSDYGLFAIAMVVIGFIALFSELGLGTALVQADKVDNDTERTACAVIVALNFLIATVLVLVAPLAAAWFNAPGLTLVIQALTLELLVSSVAAVPQAMLERALQFRQLSIAMMAAGACAAAVTLCAAWLGFGVWSLVVGNLTLAIVRSALLIMFHGRMVWPSLRLGLTPILPVVRFSSHVIASRALWYWYGQADQVILARMLHSSLLGYYNVAAQLAMLPANKAMDAINRVAFPILSKLRANPEGLKQTHKRLVGLVAAYGFAICWGLAAVAPEFVALVLGDKWRSAAVPLAMLALVAPLRMFSALHNTIAAAVGVPEAATKELAFASILIPLAVFAGAWSDGLDGAAVAWLVAFPIVYLLSNALTCAAVRVPARQGLRPVAAPLLAGIVMCAFVWAVRRLCGDGVPLPALFVFEIAAGALSYALTLHLAAPALVRDARTLVGELVNPARAG